MNKIIIAGRLVRDTELRYTKTNNVPVASFTLAVKRPFAKDEVDFIDVVAWKQKADIAHKYCSKGDYVVVSGSLQIRSYQDEKHGITRYKAEVNCDEIELTPHPKQQEEKEELPQNAPPIEDDLPFD